MVRGVIGHEFRPSAIPLVLWSTMDPDTPDAPRAALPLSATVEAPNAVLREFCSRPLPRVTTHVADQRVGYVVDLPPDATGPTDIVLADNPRGPDPHPKQRTPAIMELWALVTLPARAMVFDVYLHRDLVQTGTPSLEMHLWNLDAGQQGPTRWTTRLLGGPRLIALGPPRSAPVSAAYSRQGELTLSAFARHGWNPDEFVGYRCEVQYPLWRGGYCIVFDFTGDGPSDLA